MTDRTPPDSGRIITSSDILLHDAKTALMYEELRAAIDDGHESMTHADALAEIAAIRAENEQLRAQLEAIGAGGVSGPLMGQPQEMPDLSALTDRGAKAWAGVDAQGLREGVASAESEPVAWTGGEEWEQLAWHLCAEEQGEDACDELIWEGGPTPEPWGPRWMKYESEAKRMIELVRRFYTHPSPPEGMVGGWIALPGTLPEPGTPVLLDIGKKYPIRAMWAAKHTVEAADDDTDWGEYDEATDAYYCPEGWYEWNEHEDTNWAVSATPRAWATLPPTTSAGSKGD